MSNDQLKSHLLKEACSIALERVRRMFVFVNCNIRNEEIGSYLPNLGFLGTLLTSGKESAGIVRMILSQQLDISGNSSIVWVELSHASFVYFIRAGNIENLALRWTRFLEIKNFKRSPEFSNFLQTLRDHNCIEKLSLKTNEHLLVDNSIAIVEACRNLSTLICPPDLLVSLLERVKAPAFSKLHTIEMTESAKNWSLLFEHLKNHAEQCPVLETLTLTLSTNDDDLEAISTLAGDYSIPTIKSYNVMTEPYCCARIDFPLIASAFPMFPNLETASVTVDVGCEHRNPKKLPKVYKSFEKFNPNVEFTFNYIVEHEYTYSKTQVDELEVQLRTLGTITSVSISREDCRKEYSVATSYPNKTLKLTLTIEFDEEEAEDSEDDDDAEDSEENSDFEDNDEENSDEGSEIEDKSDSEIEDSNEGTAKKRIKLV
uniref:F-box domain-containing protein n=1 Tax=Panagrellus redivivus TaxID=6233 RepID=A0A7E4ZWQ9_PANRE